MEDVFTEEQINSYIDKFSEYDEEGKGEISTDNLQNVMNACEKG